MQSPLNFLLHNFCDDRNLQLQKTLISRSYFIGSEKISNLCPNFIVTTCFFYKLFPVFLLFETFKNCLHFSIIILFSQSILNLLSINTNHNLLVFMIQNRNLNNAEKRKNLHLNNYSSLNFQEIIKKIFLKYLFRICGYKSYLIFFKKIKLYIKTKKHK